MNKLAAHLVYLVILAVAIAVGIGVISGPVAAVWSAVQRGAPLP